MTDGSRCKLAREVVAIDIDPALLNLARARLAEHGASSRQTMYSSRTPYMVPPTRRDWPVPSGRFCNRTSVRRRQFGCPLPQEETLVLGQPRGPATALRMLRDGRHLGADFLAVALHVLEPARRGDDRVRMGGGERAAVEEPPAWAMIGRPCEHGPEFNGPREA